MTEKESNYLKMASEDLEVAKQRLAEADAVVDSAKEARKSVFSEVSRLETIIRLHKGEPLRKKRKKAEDSPVAPNPDAPEQEPAVETADESAEAPVEQEPVAVEPEAEPAPEPEPAPAKQRRR